MKQLFALLLPACLAGFRLLAQDTEKDWDAFTGVYRFETDSTQSMQIKKEKGSLQLQAGQGITDLIPLGGNRFKAERVQPATVVEFIKDSRGRVQRFHWIQDFNTVLVKKSDGNGYSGRYGFKNNPYVALDIRETDGGLVVQQGKGMPVLMHRLSTDRFLYEKDGFRLLYVFTRNGKGDINDIQVTRTGPLVLVRNAEPPVYEGQDFSNRRSFGRADSLRGYLSPERTCYDVLFYALQVRAMPETRSVAGSNTIRFRAVRDFNKMQVDLFAGLQIEKILYQGHSLRFSREYNAVFIHFPRNIRKGRVDSISIHYAGQPRSVNYDRLQGGFIWLQDQKDNPWIESVCQGSGASLWWPCKDHQDDEPDSMLISITIPDTLTEISNGRLLRTAQLPGGLMRYDWYVQYPINNYNVAVNIGKYEHFSEPFINGRDTMALHYYYLSYHTGIARRFFPMVPPMLRLFENRFGAYPFKKDGFTLMESLYPMEHQGAVSIGPFNMPIDTDKCDTAELTHLAWHETAHEWWGNSVTCKDNADLWIHEAFATYAEILCYEIFNGKDAAIKYIRGNVPGNKEPIIGRYNVNDFHLDDMYAKGGRMVYTLKNIINNDSLWFDLLRSIQQHFKYRTITSAEFETFISKKLGRNLQPFFDQYLRHTAIPELMLSTKKKGDGFEVQYKWKADVAGFDMPVRVGSRWLYPGTEWKMMRVDSADELMVNTDEFFVKVTRIDEGDAR